MKLAKLLGPYCNKLPCNKFSTELINIPTKDPFQQCVKYFISGRQWKKRYTDCFQAVNVISITIIIIIIIIIIFICAQNRIFFACSSKESCAKLDQNTLRNYLTIKLKMQTPIRRVTMTHGVLRKSFP